MSDALCRRDAGRRELQARLLQEQTVVGAGRIESLVMCVRIINPAQTLCRDYAGVRLV